MRGPGEGAELTAQYASEEESERDDRYMEDLNPFGYGIQPDRSLGSDTASTPLANAEKFTELYERLGRELKAELAQKTAELEERAKLYEQKAESHNTLTDQDDERTTATPNTKQENQSDDSMKAKALRALITLLNRHESTFAINARAPDTTTAIEHQII